MADEQKEEQSTFDKISDFFDLSKDDDSLVDIPLFSTAFIVFMLLSLALFLYMSRCPPVIQEGVEIQRGSVVSFLDDYRTATTFTKGQCAFVTRVEEEVLLVGTYAKPFSEKRVIPSAVSVVGEVSYVWILLWKIRFFAFIFIIIVTLFFIQKALRYRERAYDLFYTIGSDDSSEEETDTLQSEEQQTHTSQSGVSEAKTHQKHTTQEQPDFKDAFVSFRSLAASERKEDRVLSVIQADTLLEMVLKERGVEGDSAGEVFKNAQSTVSNLGDIWTAHKIRNELVHGDSGAILDQDIHTAIRIFNKTLGMLLGIPVEDIQRTEKETPPPTSPAEEKKPPSPPPNLPL